MAENAAWQSRVGVQPACGCICADLHLAWEVECAPDKDTDKDKYTPTQIHPHTDVRPTVLWPPALRPATRQASKAR